MKFLHEKYIFFDDFFFNFHLLIQENRAKAISERFRWFKNTNLEGKKKFSKNEDILGIWQSP